MRVCPKCGDYHADRLLGFCLADGTPLGDVDPNSDSWGEGVRILDRKATQVRAQNRKLKWRRVISRAMLMTTMVVSVAAAYSSISVTVEPARGDLCIGTFNDLNGDGKQDTGEPGIPGFVFQVSGPDPDTILTTVDGSSCEALPVGSYTVVEQPRSGWTTTTPTTQTITINAGQASNLLFGNLFENPDEKVKLCITEFDDLNGNCRQDAGEAGLADFVFQVSGTGAVTTLTTGPNGAACAVMAAGTYTVVEQPRSGWIATTRTTQTVTITPGKPANLLFGHKRERGELCITKFNDLNGNGLREPNELGLSGFVFQVRGTDTAVTLTTGLNGASRTDLPVGTYTVVEQSLSGWSATTPTEQRVSVSARQAANIVFGSRRETGKLCIEKFNDLNGNGKREPGEPGLPGFVFQARGTGLATTLTTGPTGDGCLTLPVGTYTVVEQPQFGWIATTDTMQKAIVTSGQASNMVFGSRQETGKLCIRAFNDLNGNGVRDADEPPLPEFVFVVRGTGLATTMTTGPTGDICSVFPVGSYTVVEKPRSGWIATTPTTRGANIVAGKAPENLLFGSRQQRQETSQLCIREFNDLNGNGMHDASEPDLSGFVFQVRGTGSETTLSTGPKGAVCSTLPAGTYTVVEIPKPGWTATTTTTRTVTLNSIHIVTLFFGNNRPEADIVCWEADKLRERQIISDRYEASWRRMIEAERQRIIAENSPPGTRGAEVSLGPIKYAALFRSCTAANVALQYEWLVQSPRQHKSVRGLLRFACEKKGGGWTCR